MIGISLSADQLARLAVLQDKKEYPAMYGYLHKIVTDKIMASPNNPSVPEWEKTAATAVARLKTSGGCRPLSVGVWLGVQV